MFHLFMIITSAINDRIKHVAGKNERNFVTIKTSLVASNLIALSHNDSLKKYIYNSKTRPCSKLFVHPIPPMLNGNSSSQA